MVGLHSPSLHLCTLRRQRVDEVTLTFSFAPLEVNQQQSDEQQRVLMQFDVS